MSRPYGYTKQVDPKAPEGFHFRIHDFADNRISTSYVESNAQLIVTALNRAFGNDPLEWTCGHKAGAHCAECFTVLSVKATALQAQVDELTGLLEDKSA